MSDYQSCMTSAMQGFPKGISREERGSLFCINAKLCSGKAKDKREAETLCANRPPPAPRASKRRGIDSMAIAGCLIPKLTGGQITTTQLASMIAECSGSTGGPKIRKPETKNHFVRVCALEAVTNGAKNKSFADNVKIQRECEAKWKEKQGVDNG